MTHPSRDVTFPAGTERTLEAHVRRADTTTLCFKPTRTAMNLATYFVALAWTLGCGADDPVPASSPLSWLRNRVFGSKQAEDRFLGRVAVATQSLIALVNDPVVVSEVRKYYVALLRNPDIERIVNSVREPTASVRRRPGRRRGGLVTTSSTKTTTTTTTRTTTTRTTTAAPSTTSNSSKATTGTTTATSLASITDSPTTETLPAVNETTSEPGSVVELNDTADEFNYFFDAKHVMRPPGALAELRERVRRHLNLIRMNDVDNCVSFLVCEMSRYPWRYGPLGVKVERFFRYPMWDTGSSAAHYAAMARQGRRYGGCRGRITSCRHPLGPLVQQHYSYRYP
ncbi:uncharacterized protein LOC144149229 [Haemaphysalis longicornis]